MQATDFQNWPVVKVLQQNDQDTQQAPNEHKEFGNLITKIMNEPIDYKKVYFKPVREQP